MFGRRAFLIAACLSVVTTVILFGFLTLAGILAAGVAGALASARGSQRAMTVFSAGCGLLVGPVLYLALAVIIQLAG